MPSVTVIGAGPAGSTAAIAARREGADVRIFEKSVFPRHKVCGEFLSPEAGPIFEKLGILEQFLALEPMRVREANVIVGRTVKQWTFDEPAFGISRYTLDHFLLEQAKMLGAELIREPAKPTEGATVIATGRQRSAKAGNRLFGFKAHFSGPANDRLDLLFESSTYTGINSVENGVTNLCGLAPESVLRRHQFRPDGLIEAMPQLADRMRDLTRTTDWFITGPLVFGGRFEAPVPSDIYPAGDALGFVDPFTGSGMLGALTTGFLAGRAGARGVPSSEHVKECQNLFSTQYRFAALFRRMLEWGLAGTFARFVPGPALFRLTRPSVSPTVI